MHKIFVLFSFLLAVSTSAAELLYVASGGAIEVKSIDPKTGKLENIQKVEMAGLSKFTFSRNKQFLYAQAAIANGKKKQASIATYKIANDGKLTFVHNAPISSGTTELKTDHTDKFIAAAKYGTGIVTVWKLEDGVYKGNIAKELRIEKKVHCSRFSKDNRFLMIPATGPNKVFELDFNQETGDISVKREAAGPTSGAAQPRHLVFHPTKNFAYTTLERIKPGVGVWTYDPKKGELNLIQNLANSEDATGSITNADLHLSPDNRFLYVSCRDKKGDTDHIVLYKVNDDGKLAFVKKFPCEDIPRSFCLNKSGDFAYVCGQGSAKMGVYKIDKESGHLNKVTVYETGKGPIWVETLIK